MFLICNVFIIWFISQADIASIDYLQRQKKVFTVKRLSLRTCYTRIPLQAASGGFGYVFVHFRALQDSYEFLEVAI